MRDKQLSMLKERYWYSLITAAPVPEMPDRASVGVVFGNGHAIMLRYLDRLPRLAGIAARDEKRIYEAVLRDMAARVRDGGLRLDDIRAEISPQLIVEEPRYLWAEFTDEVAERICRRYLSAPRQVSSDDGVTAVIRQSALRLDRYMDLAEVKRSLVMRWPRADRLYPELRQSIRVKAPPLARAVRGFGRDLLIDGLRFSNEYATPSVRAASFRIGEAFYAYGERLREALRLELHRDIRVVGVLQPTPKDASDEVRLARAYAAECWQAQATVIDADTVDVVDELRAHAAWVNEG